jgi:hypothetical protein
MIRRQLYARDVLVQVGVVIAAMLVLWDRTIPGTSFPLPLAIVFAAAVLSVHGRAFTSSVYAVLLTRGPFVSQSLDLQYPSDEGQNLHGWRRVVAWARKNLAAAFALITLLSWLSDVLGAYNMVHDIWEKIRQLTGW